MPGSTVVPSLRYHDALAAIDWLVHTLGFTEHNSYTTPDGIVEHAELLFETTGMVMLGSLGNSGPLTEFMAHPSQLGGKNTHAIYLVSPRTEALFLKAEAAGATILLPLRTMNYGGKAFTLRDPEGYVWSVGEYDPWHSKP